MAQDSSSDFAATQAELFALRERVRELEEQQKVGLTWREIPEDVELLLENNVPIFIREQKLDVRGKSSQDYSHFLIEGDNLHALYTLQAIHKSAIDMIYIDPPYNTGREFIFNDKLIDSENNWRHSAWLSFMSKRLQLAWELLKDEGIIVVSIGIDEHHHLKLLMDKIFGQKHLIADFTVKTPNQTDDGNVKKNADYALVYSKSEEGKLKLEGKVVEARCTTGKENQTQPVIEFPKGIPVRELEDGVYAKPRRTGGNEDIELISGKLEVKDGKLVNAVKMKARWSNPNDLKQYFAKFTSGSEEKIYNKFGSELLEVYLKGDRFQPQMVKGGFEKPSVIVDKFTSKGSLELKDIVGKADFDYPKHSELIKFFLEMGSSPDGLILDFFAGTGTTLQAAAALNAEDNGTRQVILVTNNENDICRSITIPRIKAVLSGDWAKEQQEPLPGSLRFYRTDFMKRRKSIDRMRSEVAAHAIELISIKESTTEALSVMDGVNLLFGRKKSVAVVPTFAVDHAVAVRKANELVREGTEKRAYLFTWSETGIESEIADIWRDWKVFPLPAEMLSELRKLAPERALFDENLFAGESE